jgi:transposase
MLTLPTSLRVFAKTGPTDMRRSFDGLVGLVENELHQQVESGDLFLFFNRRGDRVKALDGLVAKAQNTEEAAANSSPPRPRRKTRQPRIEFPQFWEHRKIDYSLPPEELPCGCCGAERTIIRTHVTKRAEMCDIPATEEVQ